MLAAKKLIEVALPLDAINTASAREKSIRHGHPSTLHLWWARRPLAAARAVIFTSLVEDPADEQAKPAFVEACRALPGDGDNVKAKGDSPRMRLFDFIERLVTWEATTDEAIMGQARQLIQIATGGAPPALLDPFAGGGSIPLEAQRLGLEAHASDLNPVAVMINKAMIEIPPRFAGLPPVNPDAPTLKPAPGARGDSTWKGAAGLAADLRYYGEWMRARAFERIGHLYPAHKGETVIAWLWARTVTCPNPACTATAPLVSSFALSKKKGREYWARPVIEGIAVRFEVTKGRPPKDQQGTMIRRRGSRCIVCDTPLTFDYMKSEGRAGRMGAQLMAIVTEGKRGRNYHSADEEQVRIAESATAAWEPIGSLEARYTQALLVPAYGLTEWSDLFTPRQLTALTTFSDLVRDARELAARDALAAGLADDGVPLREGGAGARAYGEAVSVYLAFAVDRAADYGSSLCIWDSRGHVQKTFGRQALPMVWDFAESNPFGTKGIPWVGHLFWICKNMMTFPSGLIQATAIQANAQSLDVNDLVPYPPPPPENQRFLKTRRLAA